MPDEEKVVNCLKESTLGKMWKNNKCALKINNYDGTKSAAHRDVVRNFLRGAEINIVTKKSKK